LVHAALADVPLTGSDLERFVRAHARRLGATEEERLAAVSAVEAALRHPLLKRATASAERRREASLTVTLPDGTLAEGIADLAYREGEQWTVVDFKTDFELDERKEEYERQLTVYARAISQATGIAAIPIILSV
jgi:ATP-dependent exoDNAse (exonuclease V) beta subunit